MSDGKIPFVRAVRISNWKMWRSKHTVKGGAAVDVLNVSTDDGAWAVRIPSTMQVYGTIVNAYATADDKLREDFIGMVLTNIYNISTCSSEALHDALFFLTEMMSFPYNLLSEKEMRERMKKVLRGQGMDRKRRNEYIDEMCGYRRQLYELIGRKRDAFIAEYERQMAERLAAEGEAEESLDSDELAEKAAEILSDTAET